MATLAGAEALGWADETGSLEAGKSADLVVVPLPPADEPDPHKLVLGSDCPVERVLIRGHWVQEIRLKYRRQVVAKKRRPGDGG